MPIVVMPNGKYVDMPDKPSSEDIAFMDEEEAKSPAAYKNFVANNPVPAPKERTTWEQVKDMGKVAGGALAQGAASTFGLLGDLAAAAGAGMDPGRYPDKTVDFINSMPASKAVEHAGKQYAQQPQNDPEKYIQSAYQGMGSAAVGPGGLIKNAVIGAMSGLGSEVGERTIGGPGGRVAGGLLGGGLAAVPSAFMGNAPSLARRAMHGVSDANIEAAIRSIDQGNSIGIPQTLGQALGKPTNLDALESALANSEQGLGVQRILREQPIAAANAVRGEIKKLPGDIVGDLKSAEIGQRGATAVIAKAKEDLSAKVKAITPTQSNMAQKDVADMMGMVNSLATKYPPGTATGDSLRELSGRLINTATGKPHVNIEILDNVFKDAASGLRQPALGAKPVDAHGQKLLSNAISDMRAMIGAKYPNFSKAKQLYADGMDTVINPLKEGVIGQIAKKNGFQEGTTTVGDVLKTVFSKGTNPDAKVSDILTAQKELTAAGQSEAFLTPAKSYLSNLLAKAVSMDSGGAGPNTAKAIKDSLQGDIMLKTGLRDTLVGMARAQKLPDDTIYPGFEKVMEVVTNAAKRPQKVMGMNPNELRGDASRNLLANAVRVFSFMPVEKVAGTTERLYSQQAMSALDKMVTTKEGIRELQRIAKLPPGSKAAQTAVATLLATHANVSEQSGKFPATQPGE